MPGDTKCPECGYLNQSAAAFCGNCGSVLRAPRARPPAPPLTLPEEITPTERQEDDAAHEADLGGTAPSTSEQCPSCLYPSETGDLFCRRCGAELAHESKYCKRCGDPIDTDEMFCNRCGLSLR